MSFFADTDALKWACCKVVIPGHCGMNTLRIFAKSVLLIFSQNLNISRNNSY